MLAAVSAVLMLSACVTSVPMGNADVSSKAKTFETPTEGKAGLYICLLYTSPSPRDGATSRMPSSA